MVTCNTDDLRRKGIGKGVVPNPCPFLGFQKISISTSLVSCQWSVIIAFVIHRAIPSSPCPLICRSTDAHANVHIRVYLRPDTHVFTHGFGLTLRLCAPSTSVLPAALLAQNDAPTFLQSSDMPGLVMERASAMDLSAPNGTQKPLPNGIPAKPPVTQNGGRITERAEDARSPDAYGGMQSRNGLANGFSQDQKQNRTPDVPVNRLDGLPIEVKQLTEHFRPFHKLIHRSVQQTWNSFSDMIDQLADLTVAPSITAPNANHPKLQINGTASGDQSRENLEKKDRLLKFQQDKRALYIKLLVLHDWHKKSRGIDQAIEISMWIHEQRNHYSQAADFVGNMKRELARWQVPNPDLKTAIATLSNQDRSACRVSGTCQQNRCLQGRCCGRWRISTYSSVHD